jgi:hypothetical protein
MLLKLTGLSKFPKFFVSSSIELLSKVENK